MNSPTISNCVLALLIVIKLAYGNNVNLNEETNVQEKITYNGDQVLRVEQVNSKQRKTIKDLENRGLLQKWYSTPTSVDVMIKNENKNIVKSVLNNGSLSFDLFIDDVQRAIDEENLPVTINDEQLGRREHNVTFENYHTLKDIYHYIDYISQEYPNIVEIENIGQSFEGTPLRVVRIKLDKNSSTTNAIWIDGGIHAREWISVSSVLYLINELVYNQDLLKTYMKNIEFHILPIVNPDGYVYSHQKERLWRKNRNKHPGSSCFGTDLNRNWAYHWGESGASKYKCAEIFRGAKAGSEPETQAIVQYIMKDPSKFKGFLTFHSYGQYILYPWGYARRVPSDHIDLQRVGQAMAAAIKEATSFEYTVGNSASLLYPAAGASDDWAKGVAKIKYAYTFELRDTGKNGFILPASHIVPTGKEAIIAATILAEEISLENSITT
ncbi:carboxypeptidase B-like [Daktulosphaira vitifoliae]|uniref:carboxypeptidase B-like n=1 Tax=Daktulosphaira vitifoliae TaxID=58002 RepID=UPI0021AA338E|nr:carboxypeptidase B-like [Daktulosphaira vitifoliae]